jgi:hypothetical protein
MMYGYDDNVPVIHVGFLITEGPLTVPPVFAVVMLNSGLFPNRVAVMVLMRFAGAEIATIATARTMHAATTNVFLVRESIELPPLGRALSVARYDMNV